MDSALDEHESSIEEGPVARGPRPRSSKNRAAEARAQQHFENIRNEGHSRTHIGNAYNTYHITERRHELQQETQGLTLKEALAFPLMRFRHDDIRAAYEGSCEWLFQTPAYNRWCDQTLQGENYGLWWITGSPGTGKSTIVKELLKRSYVSRTDEKIISYFFNAKAKGLQNNAKGMYQSLLFQMVNDSPHLQTTPNSEMLREYRSGEWPLERLKELFRDMVGSLEGTSVACYIDAVDESQDESGGGGSGEDILQNLEELAVFAYRHTLTLRICISSTMLSDTLLLRSERLILDDETGHIASIQKFAFARLGLSDHDFKSILANCIASSSHGGYQWAMELIRTLNKDKDVEDRVRLHIKLASMIATTEVPEDQTRLMELQSNLVSIWLKPAQPLHVNVQSESTAVSDTIDNSSQPQNPFEHLVSLSAHGPDLDNRRSHSLSPVMTALVNTSENTQVLVDNGFANNVDRSTAVSPTANDADKWFYNLRRYTHTLLYSGMPKNPSRKPIRVAILDSGLATARNGCLLPVARQWRRKIRNGQVQYRDFTGLENIGPFIDNRKDIHGTLCASFVLQTAPNAQIFIANVMGPDEEEQHPSHVADAIAWAVDNNVDIISMSFGWQYYQKEVDDQIKVARAKGILLFAAASGDSDSFSEHAKYPASDSKVYCIYSCRGSGTMSRFNPHPLEGKISFMFPGEDVTLLEPDHRPMEGAGRLCGTSFATPIAAGTAALVLDLVRLELKDSVEVEQRLRTYEGMSDIFKAMSGDRRGDGHYYVRPWTLLGQAEPIDSLHNVNETHQWYTLMHVLECLAERFGKYPAPLA